uniref:Uncharacterized protein n=1 Tax=Branchiostoma floridae TaxID=7739 RepID=C3ZG08_BRAFL|eukprot:XP_002592472.1 hypothetical protein BRAFLDRAFT_68958 [Branchiostoma floridae]
MNLHCRPGEEISILRANYGRTSLNPPCGGTSTLTSCRAQGSLDIVMTECQGERDCSVYASNSVFGDPCVDHKKYLEVEYVCLKDGGWCAGSADGHSTYNRYGPSTDCAGDGKGGPWANNVYEITVSGPFAVQLDFVETFDIETASSCGFDFVQVLEGQTGDSPILGTFCGTTVPPTVRTAGSTMTVRFRTDGSVTRTGFKAKYSVLVICPTLPSPSQLVVSDHVCKTYGCTASFSCSTGYQLTSDSPNQTVCQADGMWSGQEPACQAEDGLFLGDCPSGFQEWNISCYKAFPISMSYDAAETFCSTRLGRFGRLATAKDMATNRFLINLKNAVQTNERFWLGLSDRTSEGSWRWSDGNNLGAYTYWAPGEPNDSVNEDCAEFWPSFHPHSNEWNDQQCSDNIYFICESTTTDATVCEHETMNLHCRPGEEISILRANYGRTSRNPPCGGTSTLTSCRTQGSLDIVMEACQGERDCSVYASNTVFGDPCVDHKKYLEVEYICLKALSRGFTVFAVQDGGWCAGSADGHSTYNRYGPSTDCAGDGKGGPWANDVYEITVSGPFAVQLDFVETFDIETASSCGFDFVQVLEGQTGDSPILGTFCGTTVPPTVRTAGDTMTVRFRTDGSVTWTGFKAKYSVIVICPTLPSPSQLVVSDHVCKTYGCTVSFSCSTGFELTSGSPNQTVCQADGTWSGQEPACQAIACPALPSPSQLVVSDHMCLTYGCTASFSCSTGFELTSGSPNQTVCQADGTWSGQEPVCQDHVCMTYGCTASFSCSTGFELTSDSPNQTVCQADGMWSGQEPVCQVIHCPELQRPEYGNILANETAWGSVIEFECEYGFSQGSTPRTCQGAGTWSGNDVICKGKKPAVAIRE